MAYDVGDIGTVSVAITDSAGVPADPQTVTLTIRKPDGTTLNWIVTAGQIVKDSTGNYHADLTLDTAGVWSWTWTGSGTGPNIGESGSLDVRGVPSAFATPDELATHMGVPSSSIDGTRARLILEAATQKARSIMGHSLSRIVGDTYTVSLVTPSVIFMLPWDHVTAVTSVVENGTTLTADTDYFVNGSALYRIVSGTVTYPTYKYWAVAPKDIVVTATHGYADIPADVKYVVLQAAGRAWTNSNEASIGQDQPYPPVEARGWAPDLTYFPDEQRTLEGYGQGSWNAVG